MTDIILGLCMQACTGILYGAGFHTQPFLLSVFYAYIIFTEPVINLKHVSEHLRTGHQLSIPWPAIIRWGFNESVYFGNIEQSSYWRGCV